MVWQPAEKKNNSEFKPVVRHLNIAPVPHPAPAEGLGKCKPVLSIHRRPKLQASTSQPSEYAAYQGVSKVLINF